MSSKSNRNTRLWLACAALLFGLACSITLFPATATPISTATAAKDATKIALDLQATQASLQLTQAVLDGGGQPPPLTEPPVPGLTGEPTQEAPTEEPFEPTPDLQARMSAANVLVYENTDERNIGLWIKDALNNLGLTYTHTGSYSGHFMQYLNSGAYYDLIIVGAEDKDIISGEFWDVIDSRLERDNAALIVEIWYLDTEANGRISKIMNKCGIAYRKDYDLADSIYWWVPTHPVFNEPNQVAPLLHYSRFWAGQTGDQIRLSGTGDAVLLAGLTAAPGEGGVLAACVEGRVIFQTFSDHDYHEEDVVPLWENYIYNTLRAHFAVTP